MVRDVDAQQVAAIIQAILENPVGFVSPLLVNANVSIAELQTLKKLTPERAAVYLSNNAPQKIKLEVFGGTHTFFAYLTLFKFRMEELQKILGDDDENPNLLSDFFTKVCFLFTLHINM